MSAATTRYRLSIGSSALARRPLSRKLLQHVEAHLSARDELAVRGPRDRDLPQVRRAPRVERATLARELPLAMRAEEVGRVRHAEHALLSERERAMAGAIARDRLD